MWKWVIQVARYVRMQLKYGLELRRGFRGKDVEIEIVTSEEALETWAHWLSSENTEARGRI